MPRPPRKYAAERRFNGGASRIQTINEYNNHLRRAKKVVGHGTTTDNIELGAAMKKLGLNPGKVCTECDVREMKEGGALPPYVIANIMCEPPGKHWVAYYKGYKYDPLGKDSSKSAEQNDEETNCGQRCLAYLAMCKKKNKTIAL